MHGLWTIEAENYFRCLNPILQFRLNDLNRPSDRLPSSLQAKSIWTFRNKEHHYDLTLPANTAAILHQFPHSPYLTATQQNLGSLRIRQAHYTLPLSGKFPHYQNGNTYTYDVAFWLTSRPNSSLLLPLAEDQAIDCENVFIRMEKNHWPDLRVMCMGNKGILRKCDIGKLEDVEYSRVRGSSLDARNLLMDSVAVARIQFRTVVSREKLKWRWKNSELLVIGNQAMMGAYARDSEVLTFLDVPVGVPSLPVLKFEPRCKPSVAELFNKLCEDSSTVNSFHRPPTRPSKSHKKAPRVESSSGLAYSGGDELCIICFDSLTTDQLWMPSCQHGFHNKCLKAWVLHGSGSREDCITCPICLQVQVRTPGPSPKAEMRIYFLREDDTADHEIAIARPTSGSSSSSSTSGTPKTTLSRPEGSSSTTNDTTRCLSKMEITGYYIFIAIELEGGVQETSFGHPIRDRKYAATCAVLTLPMSYTGLKTLSYYTKTFSAGLLLQFDQNALWGSPNQVIWNKIPFRHGNDIDDQVQLERVQQHCKRCGIELNRYDLKFCNATFQSVKNVISSCLTSQDSRRFPTLVTFSENYLPPLPR